MNQRERAPIIVFRDRLLPASETFIKSQAEQLEHFVPYYVGSSRFEGLHLPAERTVVLNRGNLFGMFREFAFKAWGMANSLTRDLRRLHAVLIHAHFGIDGALALPLRRALDLPLIVTFHGYDATTADAHAARSFYSHRMYLRRRGALMAEGELFLAVSRFIRDRLIEQGYPPEKTIVHHIGVDTTTLRTSRTLPREPVVLFVGRLLEVKGCEYLLRAMQGVRERVPEAEVVVIGDGPLADRLQKMAHEARLPNRFLGHQTSESVRGWMERARVLCVPSVTADSGAREGLSMVCAEAQAMGLPIAGFSSGGIPEVVAHEETGLLAEERDWENLGRHISVLLEDDVVWQRYSAAGRVRVRKEFNLRTQTHILEELYSQILAKTRGRAN